MTFQKITTTLAAKQYKGMLDIGTPHAGPEFKAELDAAVAFGNPSQGASEKNPSRPLPLEPPAIMGGNSSFATVASLPLSSSGPSRMSGWEKYKEDQLLSNPGGDRCDITPSGIRCDGPAPTSFLGRVGKDFFDGIANIANGVKNLFMGSTSAYRDSNGDIQTVTKGGILRSIGNFVKKIGSVLTLGQWQPDAQKVPDGVIGRGKYALSTMKNAVMGDLLQGVCGSTLQIGEDLVLAGWNLVEVVPDATIGNFDTGRKLTTAIFDNGQVVVDYLTDILPSGEAWLRVHAVNLRERKLPVFYNLSLKERYDGDERWQTVRNTPFRKTIETIGALLADVAMVRFFSNTQGTSESQKKETTG